VKLQRFGSTSSNALLVGISPLRQELTKCQLPVFDTPPSNNHFNFLTRSTCGQEEERPIFLLKSSRSASVSSGNRSCEARAYKSRELRNGAAWERCCSLSPLSNALAMDANIFPQRSSRPDNTQIERAINTCLKVQERGVEMGKQPFAAVLVSPDNEEVLLSHSNIDHVNHAESSLARLAALHYSQAYLWRCTLYSTWEPCAMCIATCYWANIGRIVYAASEEQLMQLTGASNEKNMTMAMPCRKVLLGSQKDIEILGPIDGMDEKVIRLSGEYWRSSQN